MTIGQIKSLMAAYLHKQASDFIVGTGPDQIDILLSALNHARKEAEKVVDFSVCRQKGYLKIFNQDGDWSSSVTWFDGGDWIARRVRRFLLRTTGDENDGEFGGVDRALRSITRDQQSEIFARKDYQYAPQYPGVRYPGDAIIDPMYNPLLNQPYACVRGAQVGLYPVPSTTQTLIVDAYVWWPDYSSNSDDDWFTQHCSKYLLNAGLCEANNLVRMFLAGSDSTVPPPTKEAAQALQLLVATEMEAQEGTIEIRDF